MKKRLSKILVIVLVLSIIISNQYYSNSTAYAAPSDVTITMLANGGEFVGEGQSSNLVLTSADQVSANLSKIIPEDKYTPSLSKYTFAYWSTVSNPNTPVYTSSLSGDAAKNDCNNWVSKQTTSSDYIIVDTSIYSKSQSYDYDPQHYYTISNNLMIYAQYRQNAFNVEYNANGGHSTASGDSASIDKIDEIGQHTYVSDVPFMKQIFIRPGYEFAGWQLEPGDTTSENIAISSDGGIILKSNNTNNTTNVADESESGNVVSGDIIVSEDNIPSIIKFISENSLSNLAGYKDYTAGASLKLYAAWTPIHYTVIYHGNDIVKLSGNKVDTISQDMIYDKEYSLISQNSTKVGNATYNLNNWNSLENGTGISYNGYQKVKNLVSFNNGVYNLYSQWDRQGKWYKIYYHSNTASSNSTVSQDIQSYALTQLSSNTFSNGNKSFVGWGLSSNSKEPKYFDSGFVTVSGDLHLYAIWSADASIKYMSQIQHNGKEVVIIKVSNNKAVKTVALSNNAIWKDFTTLSVNYAFQFSDELTTGCFINNQLCTGTDMFTKCNTSGEALGTQIYEIDKSISVGSIINVQDPSETGCEFKGWDIGILPDLAPSTGIIENKGKSYIINLHGLELHAMWRVVSYNIAIDYNNGSSGTTQMWSYRSRNVLSSNIGRTGYHLSGWAVTSGPGSVIYEGGQWKFKVGAGESTVQAQWAPNLYTINFDSNGGGSCGSIQVYYDSPFGSLPYPTNGTLSTGEGQFAGWSYGSTYIGNDTVDRYAGDITLTANWSNITFIRGVTYSIDPGTNIGSEWAINGFKCIADNSNKITDGKVVSSHHSKTIGNDKVNNEYGDYKDHHRSYYNGGTEGVGTPYTYIDNYETYSTGSGSNKEKHTVVKSRTFYWADAKGVPGNTVYYSNNNNGLTNGSQCAFLFIAVGNGNNSSYRGGLQFGSNNTFNGSNAAAKCNALYSGFSSQLKGLISDHDSWQEFARAVWTSSTAGYYNGCFYNNASASRVSIESLAEWNKYSGSTLTGSGLMWTKTIFHDRDSNHRDVCEYSWTQGDWNSVPSTMTGGIRPIYAINARRSADVYLTSDYDAKGGNPSTLVTRYYAN